MCSIEPLGEPAVDGDEEVAGFGGFASRVPEAGEAGGGAEFPHLARLCAGNTKRLAIVALGFAGIFERNLCSENVAEAEQMTTTRKRLVDAVLPLWSLDGASSRKKTGRHVPGSGGKHNAEV